MRQSLTLTSYVVLSASFLGAWEAVPEIGMKLADKRIPESAHHNLCITHSAQMDPCFEKVIRGVRYTIAFDARHRVTYISTRDPAFRTEDGHRVGEVIEVQDDALEVILGWQIHAPKTRDGWRPIVGFDLGSGPSGRPEFDIRGYQPKLGGHGKAKILGFSKGRL
jgi:hypothetical protein